MLFSSIYQSMLAQFSRRKLPDNGLYTEYIKKFCPMSANFLLANGIPKYCK